MSCPAIKGRAHERGVGVDEQAGHEALMRIKLA
jgi:hypothetical protein